LSVRSLEVYIAHNRELPRAKLAPGSGQAAPGWWPKLVGPGPWHLWLGTRVQPAQGRSRICHWAWAGPDSWLGCCRCCSRLRVSAAETSLLTRQRISR